MAEKRKNAFRYNLFIRKKAREEKLRMTPVIHYRLHKLRKKLNERYIIRFFQFATTKNGNVATRLSRPEFRSSTFFPVHLIVQIFPWVSLDCVIIYLNASFFFDAYKSRNTLSSRPPLLKLWPLLTFLSASWTLHSFRHDGKKILLE